MKRVVTLVAALTVAGGLAACGGSGSSGDTTVQASRPASSSSSAAPSSSSGSDGAGTAAKLPAGFPLPAGAQPQGSASSSDALTIADYTVPDGKKAYDGLVADLPRAGWTISAKTWNDDLGSGTVTAAGNGTDVKLLVLDKDLSLSIKKS